MSMSLNCRLVPKSSIIYHLSGEDALMTNPNWQQLWDEWLILLISLKSNYSST